jgi:putative ABC transport system permease protein
MKFLTIPLRNVMRNRRRSIMTIVAVLIGAFTIVLFGGYTNAVSHGVETGFVRQLGHLQIQKNGYFLYGSGDPARFGIAGYEKIIAEIKADPEMNSMVEVVTPVLQWFGIAGNFADKVSRTVGGAGVVPADQNRMRTWNQYHFPGAARMLSLPDDEPNSAVIGTGVARTLKLCKKLSVPNCDEKAASAAAITVADQSSGRLTPSDILALAALETSPGGVANAAGPRPRIEILAATARGAPNVASVMVTAAENQGIKELDDTFVAMPLPLAQQLVYGESSGQATSLVVQLKKTEQMAAARARLETLLAKHGTSLEIVDFSTLNPTYDQIRGLFKSIFGFIAILMGAIVLFSVANTMSMAVVERTVEIGTLRSMGVQRSAVERMFMIEGVLIGAIGAVIGIILAMLVAAGINAAGLTWTPPSQVEPIPFVIHLDDVALIVGTLFTLIQVAGVSSVLPARRAARLPIIDSLRHV